MVLLATAISVRAEDDATREPAPQAESLYDSDPQHLWNRLYETIFIRTARNGDKYGFDSLDPLLWSATNHLLADESHGKAIRVLDEFIEKHGETLIKDHFRRAILQHDLWAVFDWAATRNLNETVPVHEAEVQALTLRLAKVIQSLALSKVQIQLLPDNYAAAVSAKAFPGEFDPQKPDTGFLPVDLFKKDGPWVCIETGDGLAAPIHTREFGGRSVFLIFMKLPKGRAETLAYLKKLNSFPESWIYDRARIEKTDGFAMMLGVMPHRFDLERPPWVNPDMPQFPSGTQFALVRQAVLIGSDDKLYPSHLTESVQLRVYGELNLKSSDGGKQSVFEFTMQRQRLFAGKTGGLHTLKKIENNFSVFLAHGTDIFESKGSISKLGPQTGRNTLNCMGCHGGAGIHSVLSHSQLFSAATLHPPRLQEYSPERIGVFTIRWKENQFSWGLLRGLWR